MKYHPHRFGSAHQFHQQKTFRTAKTPLRNPISLNNRESKYKKTLKPQLSRKQLQTTPQRSKKKQSQSKSKSASKMQKPICDKPKYSIQMAMQFQDLEFDPPLLTSWGISNPVKMEKNPNYQSEKNYQKVRFLGQGSTGQVWEVKSLKNGKCYAMKEMSKAKAIAKRNIQYIMNERQLLSQFNHEFLVNMNSAFQSQNHLYLVMSLMPGGDLRLHMRLKQSFTEEQVRFFTACILTSLQYLIGHCVVHRDIKPENLVFDQQGYLHLTDLGTARKLRQKQSCFGQISGTLGYIAPQVFRMKKYKYQVDYFSLGVIVYELIFGHRPFAGKSKEELIVQFKREMQNPNSIIPKNDIPEGWSIQSADFVNRLLSINPEKRLGYNSFSELKSHNWLKDFPWEMLYKKQLCAPYKSMCQQLKQTDFQRMNSEKESQFLKSYKENEHLLQEGLLQDLFEGYTFYDNAATITIEPSKMINSTGPSYEIGKSNNK